MTLCNSSTQRLPTDVAILEFSCFSSPATVHIGQVLRMSFLMRLESITHSLSMCIMSLNTYRYFLSSVVTTTANPLDGCTNPEVWYGMPSLFRSRTISDGSSVHSRIGVLEVQDTLGAGYIVETLRTIYSVCGYVIYDMPMVD